MMRCSVALPPPATLAEARETARRVEDAGMRALWLYDTPGELPDPFLLFPAVAEATASLRFGPCVTSPVLRDPLLIALQAATAHRLSDGRMELGLGRGGAFLRGLGRRPASVAALREAVAAIRAVAGNAPESPLPAPWVVPEPLPIWIGTYGPRGLALAGEVADGVILQFTDAELVAWAVARVRDGARRAGRDPAAIRVMAAGPLRIHADATEAARRTGDFVALLADELAAVFGNPAAEAPPRFRDRAAAWTQAAPTEREALARELADDVALLGPPARVGERLAALAECGVDEVTAYLPRLDPALADWSRVTAPYR